MGLTSLASAFSTNLPELATLRFFAGVGAAFFFSPALSLIASYFPPGRRGPVIGLYNGGFSLGGAAGLAAGAVAGSAFGWPGALALGGGALLVMVAVNQVVLPPDLATRRSSSAAQLWNAASGILSSRSVWALALALTGFWAAVFIVAQDFVTYASEVHPNWGGTTAATLAAVVILLSFPGGPLGGWLAERPVDRRTWLAIFAGGSGLTVLAIPILGLVAVGVDFVLLGLFDGIAFAVLYVIPSYLAETRGQGVALGIAFLNSVQVLLGSAATVLFGYVAVFRGFTVAWIFAGLLTVALLPLLLWVTPNRGMSPTGVEGHCVSTTKR